MDKQNPYQKGIQVSQADITTVTVRLSDTNP